MSGGHPVQILAHQGEGFKVVEEALDTFMHTGNRLLEWEVVVIAVVGEYRKGKSFFLGLLMRFLLAEGKQGWMVDGDERETFKHQFGSNRVTDGITMWSEPLLFNNKVVILLDSEGTYDEQATQQTMSNVFAVSALVSSLLVFNVDQRITQQLMVEVQAFTEYGKMISKNQGMKPFQSLMFLVRNFLYPNEYPYGEQGGQNHLNHWLNAENVKKEGMTATLTTCFTDCSAFLIPEPSKDVKMGKFSGRTSDMGEDFVTHMSACIEKIFSTGCYKTKMGSGTLLKLRDFKTFFLIAATSVVGSNFEFANVYQAQVKYSNETALRKFLHEYRTAMESEMERLEIKPIANFSEYHEKQRKAALSGYDDTPKFGSPDQIAVYRTRLCQGIVDTMKQVEIINKTRAKLMNETDEKNRRLVFLEAEKEEMKLKHEREMAELENKFKEMEMENIRQKEDIEDLKRTYESERIKSEKLFAAQEKKFDDLRNDVEQSKLDKIEMEIGMKELLAIEKIKALNLEQRLLKKSKKIDCIVS